MAPVGDQQPVLLEEIARLRAAILRVHQAVRREAGARVNTLMNARNWLLGAMILEFEETHRDLLGNRSFVVELASHLEEAEVPGMSLPNLRNFRQLAATWPLFPIAQTLSSDGTMHKLTEELQSGFEEVRKLDSKKLEWRNSEWTLRLFTKLTFSHLMVLSRVQDELERSFYEIETLKEGWTVRELERQINSLLFHRVGLSRDKEKVLALAREGTLSDPHARLFRDPYVLEFLELTQHHHYTEEQLEQALIDHLQPFLLEMGGDFCFLKRQFPMRIGAKTYYLDLLFFHRALHCLVAIELKVGEFDHADAGQMTFYLNWLRENAMKEGENPPVGIMLCSSKDEEIVHYATSGQDQEILVSQYKLALPTPQELSQFLHRTRLLFEEEARS